MARINATVRDKHIEQLEDVKEEADGEISDAEATRRIFDRAARAQELAQELRDYGREVGDLRAELGQERARRDEAVAKTRDELREEHEREITDLKAQYEEEIEDLENENERLQRQLVATNRRVDQHQELVRTVERQQSLAERKARAGLLTKTKWALFGMGDDEEEKGN